MTRQQSSRSGTTGRTSHPPQTGTKVALVGGADVRCRVELVQLLSQDYEVVVLGPDRSMESAFKQVGAAYRFFPMSRGISPWRDLVSPVTLVRHFRSIRPNIVHTYDSKPCALG